jgi:hypothetical protein
MVIDGQHYRGCMSLEVLFWIGRILYEGKCQDESFSSLDGMKVRYNRLGETFHGDTTKAAVSVKGLAYGKAKVSMAHRSPYGVKPRTRFFVMVSPAEMRFGRSEYMFDRFSSRSMATRWLLMTRTPRLRALTYIIPPNRNMSEFLWALST